MLPCLGRTMHGTQAVDLARAAVALFMLMSRRARRRRGLSADRAAGRCCCRHCCGPQGARHPSRSCSSARPGSRSQLGATIGVVAADVNVLGSSLFPLMSGIETRMYILAGSACSCLRTHRQPRSASSPPSAAGRLVLLSASPTPRCGRIRRQVRADISNRNRAAAPQQRSLNRSQRCCSRPPPRKHDRQLH